MIKFGMKYMVISLVSVFCCSLILFFSCSESLDKRATKVAEKALYSLTSDSIKITKISKPEMFYGLNFITPKEKDELSKRLLKYTNQFFEETDYFQDVDEFDAEMSEKVNRQVDAMNTLRLLCAYGEIDDLNKKHENVQKPFNGWKVKITFETKSPKGFPYRSEYWFILDKKAEIVVKSFEIPLLY